MQQSINPHLLALAEPDVFTYPILMRKVEIFTTCRIQKCWPTHKFAMCLFHITVILACGWTNEMKPSLGKRCIASHTAVTLLTLTNRSFQYMQFVFVVYGSIKKWLFPGITRVCNVKCSQTVLLLLLLPGTQPFHPAGAAHWPSLQPRSTSGSPQLCSQAASSDSVMDHFTKFKKFIIKLQNRNVWFTETLPMATFMCQ